MADAAPPPSTVGALVTRATERLAASGSPSSRLDAELLLAHTLGAKRMDLYMTFDQPVEEAERARFRELVRRRAKERCPVAYLTETREFWSLPFRVTPDVLIPRPETELLVRAAVDRKPRRVAELGVGSGCVSAALARELPEVLRIVRFHHERLDGRGFPDGLRGEKIPMEARIVAVADTFDAITTRRPYRESRSPEDAVDELRRVAGTQLDPEAVEAFVEAFPNPGTLPLSA